jgi:DNA mismatch repair protein MutL
LYLARPSVGLTLSNEHGELARYPPAGNLRDAAARVFGPEFLRQAFDVRSGLGTALAVRGVLARPGLSRSNSFGLYLSVNGRVVHARPLVQAIRQAYADYLPRTRYPVGAVDLEIDPARVDVNVHPTKREVRIAREREVGDELRHVVRAALLSTPHVSDPAGALPSQSPEPIEAEIPLDGPTLGGPRTSGVRAVQRTIGEAPVAARVAASVHHPALRLVGPVFDLYWLAESDGALVLVDQHAASERVLYEALRREGRLARQELVEPVRIDLSALRAKVLETHAEVVRRGGFEVEPFGPGTFRVRSVPTYRGRRAHADQLIGLLDELSSGGRPAVPDGMVERANASIACHAAIRAGDVVPSEEIRRVLEALYALPEASYACPHGRPILIRFDRGRVDRWFLRSPT